MENPTTLRSDEAAAEEFVRLVEDFFLPEDKISFKVAKEREDGPEVFYAYPGVGKKSGLLFRTATTEARASLMEILQTKELRPEQVNSDILTSYISATVGTDIGAADAKLLKLDESISGAKLGYGIGTARPTQDHTRVMKITSKEISDPKPLKEVIDAIPLDVISAAIPLSMISAAIPRQ